MSTSTFKCFSSRLAKILLAFGFMFLMVNTRAFGQFVFYEFPGAPGSPPSSLGPDPSGGVVPAPVLIYSLPILVTPGDVLLTETAPAGTTNTTPPSDIVRFFQDPTNPNQSIAILYSDKPESALEIPDPADVGLPTQFMPNVAGPFMEVGTEGNNSYHYIPAPGMPGSAGSAVVDYLIISDVPEPSSCVLAGVGGGLMLLLRWRWTKRE